MNEKRFLAALQGIDLDKEIEKNNEDGKSVSSGDGPKTNNTASSDGYIFKDPKAYEGWTQEEKEAETQRMLGQLKSFVGQQKDAGVMAAEK